MAQGLRSCPAVWKRLSISPTICLPPMGKVGCSSLRDLGTGPDGAALGPKPSPAHPQSCLGRGITISPGKHWQLPEDVLLGILRALLIVSQLAVPCAHGHVGGGAGLS